MTEHTVPAEDKPDPDPVADELRVIKHRAHLARLHYERQVGIYRDFTNDIVRVIKTCLDNQKVNYHTITGREKDPAEFEKKAAQTSSDDPSEPKYSDPLNQITDKAAVRITTYFLETVEAVLRVVDSEFDVLERIDKSSNDPDKLGYQSIHYLVRYPRSRTNLSDFQQFSGLVAEVQVRTILQHAWAEIEHDIQYKAVAAVPELIRRRFTALAGLIEIADREFQAIANENLAIKTQARININAGELDQVEITRDSFKEYIDKKYGPDGRMREYSYDYAVRTLLALGFTNLGEVDECLKGYNDDAISRALWGSRMGQLTRFEYVLIASMSEYFILAHQWAQRDDYPKWYIASCIGILDKMRQKGIDVGTYRPPGYPKATRFTLKDLDHLRSPDDGQSEVMGLPLSSDASDGAEH